MIKALNAHVPEALFKLREEHNGDIAALAAHPELQVLPDEMRIALAKALAHWHPVTFDENGKEVKHPHLKHDEL